MIMVVEKAFDVAISSKKLSLCTAYSHLIWLGGESQMGGMAPRRGRGESNPPDAMSSSYGLLIYFFPF